MNDTVAQKMREIVEDCMGESPAYCQTACPMHTDVKGYVSLIGEGKYKEAVALVREKLFMPAILGRICAHPCEDACKRNELHSPMSIAALKRFVADNHDDPELWAVDTAERRSERVAVIGAGPAGAQAAHDLLKEGYEVTVFDRLPVVGGMMRVGIPSYRLPRDVIELEYSILQRMGLDLRLNTEIGKDITFEELRENYDGVIVAVGAHKGIVIPVPGHELEGVFNAVEYLREVSLTGNFEKVGKRVVVIGGGNVAVDAARTTRRLAGVESVDLVMLEGSTEEAPAHDWEIEETLEEGISIHFGWGTEEIVGDNGKVTEIRLKKCTSVFDPDGRFNPRYDEREKEPVACDTVVFAIGQGVDPSFAPELETARGGRFVVDDLTLQTSMPNVFVAGDATGHSVIAVEALAEGRKAAKSLHRLLNGESLTSDREGERAFETDLETEIPEDANREPRVATRRLDPSERIKSFAEVDLGLSEEQALSEAGRCLSCECLKCMKECTMLNDFTSCPKELFEGILAEPEIINADPKIAYSCNMCKQCTLACPKEFDMQGVFGGMRKEYVAANNGKSPMKGHNVIYMHQKLGFSKPFNTTVASPDGVTKRVFIPGCSLPSYNPEAVGKMYSHLQERLGNTGAILKCCGKPTKALGQYDLFKQRYAQLQAEIDKLGAEEIIVACQSCFLNMSEYSPNQKVRSLWEVLPEIGLPEGAEGIGADSDVTFAVHDSCSTRDVSSIHDGIRWILEKTGYQMEEPPHTRENGMCCGFGGMVVPANPDLAQRVMSKRTSEVKSDQMVTYCAACRESMVKGGKDALHILDLVYNPTYRSESEYPGAGGSPLTAWVNRYKAKKALEQAAKRAPAGALA